MSSFDFDKLMASAVEDLDAEKRKKINAALTAAVEATEVAIRARADQVLTDAQDRLTVALNAKEEELSTQSTSDLEEAAQRNQEAFRALEDAQSSAISRFTDETRKIETDISKAKDAALSAKNSLSQQLDRFESAERGAARTQDRIEALLQCAATKLDDHAVSLMANQRSKFTRDLDTAKAILDQLGDKTDQFQQRLADPVEARKWAFITIGAAAGAALVFALLLWAWGSWTIGRSEHRVEQAEAELSTISMELNELRLLQQQIGLEIRRNDSDIIEIALGDVVLRPYKGQTLVIADEGRALKPFSVVNERTAREHSAAVRGQIFYEDPDGISQYSGRVWRTVDEE